MNLIKSIAFMIFGLCVSTSCCGNNKPDAKTSVNTQIEIMENKGKSLVVYFSHAGENYAVGNIKVGNTKVIAGYIKEFTGADEFEIVAEKSYDMPYIELIKLAQEETEKNEKPAFKGEVKNIDEYTTIFIGGPIWWGTYPQVMFTFFDTYDLNGKTIIPFTTHEGSGLGNTVEDLKRLYPSANFKQAKAFRGKNVKNAKHDVETWLNEITN